VSAGDLHGHGHPATLQTGKRRQAYQGGVGRRTMICFFDCFFEKNDPISSKIHLRNHNKKDKKLCSIGIEHIEMISAFEEINDFRICLCFFDVFSCRQFIDYAFRET